MPDINVNKVSEALNTKADIDLNNTGVFSTSSGGVNLVQSTPSDAKGKEVTSADFSLKQGGLELMDVVFAPLGIDESKNKRRYLNGQVIIQEQFPAFTSAVKSRMSTMANAFTTETNWQAEKTNSKFGQCGKFVVDDTAGTIRLPCVVNAQGLVDLSLIGGIKSESLPNITGSTYIKEAHGNCQGLTNYTGCFSAEDSGALEFANGGGDAAGNLPRKLIINASLSSSTYQNNAPVQQEAVQYPYCIVVNTGVDETDRPINNYQVNNVYSYGMSQYYKGTMNNNSWLKSAGQWNDGTVYTGMYNWLLEQMNNGVSGFVASTATYTDYDFVINTADQTFRLPLIAERVLVAKKEPTDGDYTWYNLYSDGWLEQGGYVYQAGGDTGVVSTTTFPKAFKNNDYAITMSAGVGNSGWQYANGVGLGTAGAGANERETHMTPTTFTWFNAAGAVGVPIFWEAKGYAEVPTEAEYTEVKGLYYYIGDTLQNAQLVNVARIEEKLTDMNATSRGYMVESYHNGTEWYRIYSDGWIEQGGRFYNNADVANTISFLKPFKNTDYSLLINHGVSGKFDNATAGRHSDEAWGYTTTNFQAQTYNAAGLNWIVWSACGY